MKKLTSVLVSVDASRLPRWSPRDENSVEVGIPRTRPKSGNGLKIPRTQQHVTRKNLSHVGLKINGFLLGPRDIGEEHLVRTDKGDDGLALIR